jgi:hypothetical protein
MLISKPIDPFTMTDAMQIQADCLARWKKLLKKETFLELEKRVLARNQSDLTNPYDVCRGTHIDQIVITMQKCA